MKLSARPRTRKPSGRQPHHALTTAFVRNAAQAGRYCDGDGLYLDVQPTATRSWVQRLVIRGRRRELGLGAPGLVSLAEAIRSPKRPAEGVPALPRGPEIASRARARGDPSEPSGTRRLAQRSSSAVGASIIAVLTARPRTVPTDCSSPITYRVYLSLSCL